MPYSIAIAAPDDGQYIAITVEGNVTRRNALEWVLEAHALGCKAGIHRYLVDVTQARNVDRVIENYDFAYVDQQGEGIDRSARTACLAAPEDDSHDFVAIAIASAGGDFRLFKDRRLAVDFLVADEGAGRDDSVRKAVQGPAENE